VVARQNRRNLESLRNNTILYYFNIEDEFRSNFNGERPFYTTLSTLPAVQYLRAGRMSIRCRIKQNFRVSNESRCECRVYGPGDGWPVVGRT
jgi:hypothetical protein